MAEKSKSPWVWIGCGCAAIVGFGLVVIGGLTFVGVQTARTMADPEAREAKALQILSAGAIPSGYETKLAMSIPFFAEVVEIQDEHRDFVFLKGLRSRGDLAAAFDQDDDGFEAELRRAGLRIGRRQTILARGALQLDGAEARYILADGGLGFDASGRARFHLDDDDEAEAEVGAAVVIRCAPGDKPGIGLWSGPRADPDADPADVTADQAALREFVEAFGFCH